MESRGIVEEAGNTSEVLWLRLAKLFTTLSLHNPMYDSHEKVSASLDKSLDMLEEFAFPEDFGLKGTSLLGKEREARIRWDQGWNVDDTDMVRIRRKKNEMTRRNNLY